MRPAWLLARSMGGKDLEGHGLAMALKMLEVLPKMLEKSVANLGDYLVVCTPWVSSVHLDKPLLEVVGSEG